MMDVIIFIQKKFCSLSESEQIKTLITLAYEATIWARESYLLSVQDHSTAVERLQGFNELQHQLTQHISHLLISNPLRYPDDVLISILWDITKTAGCQIEFVSFFKYLPNN